MRVILGNHGNFEHFFFRPRNGHLFPKRAEIQSYTFLCTKGSFRPGGERRDPEEDEEGQDRPGDEDAEEEGGTRSRSPRGREEPRPTSAASGRAGGSRWTSFEAEGINVLAEQAAFQYVKVIDEIEDQEASTWRRICEAGDALLEEAGSVEQAAKALWIVREKLDRNKPERGR